MHVCVCVCACVCVCVCGVSVSFRLCGFIMDLGACVTEDCVMAFRVRV
jgi:hypothetical protein